MDTDLTRPTPVRLSWFFLFGAAVIVVGIAIAMRGDSITAGPPLDRIPSDFSDAGLVVEPLAPVGTITLDEALKSVSNAYGDSFRDAQFDSYLVRLTDPATFDGAVEMRDRPTWLVRASGFSWPEYGTILGEPDDADVADLVSSVAHIYVDAISGEWLMTRVFADSQ